MVARKRGFADPEIPKPHFWIRPMTREDLIATLVRIKRRFNSRRSIRRVIVRPDVSVAKNIHRGSFIDKEQRKKETTS